MTEIFAFGTLGDILRTADNCVNVVKAYYVASRDYATGQDVDVYSSLGEAIASEAKFLYALPDIQDIVKIFLSKNVEGNVSYIMDRVGSAAVSLNFYDLSPNKINAFSLSYRSRIYREPDAGLIKTPWAFQALYTDLRKCLSKNSMRASNTVEPRSVFVLPEAFQKASDGSLPLPWESVVLPKEA